MTMTKSQPGEAISTGILRFECPLGVVEIEAATEGVTRVSILNDDADVAQAPESGDERIALILRSARDELTGYFAGEIRSFQTPLAPQGTPFQQRVWAELRNIPHGETISYAQLAERVGSEGGQRAVGQANGRNPIWVMIPCHRVVRSDGNLGGYAGELWRKEKLLELEGALEPQLSAAH